MIRGHLALRKGVVGKIPKRLLALAWFVHGLNRFTIVMDIHEKSVVRAEHELSGEFVITMCECDLYCFRVLDMHACGDRKSKARPLIFDLRPCC